MTGTCSCGRVEITLQTPPEFIYDCNCSLCRKSGGAWGYFTAAQVVVKGETTGYSRADKTTPIVEVHACPHCAATTHFILAEAYQKEHPELDQVGVNMRLFDPEALTGIEIHYPDGKAWSGEGPFGFRKPSLVIGPETPW